MGDADSTGKLQKIIIYISFMFENLSASLDKFLHKNLWDKKY